MLQLNNTPLRFIACRRKRGAKSMNARKAVASNSLSLLWVAIAAHQHEQGQSEEKEEDYIHVIDILM